MNGRTGRITISFVICLNSMYYIAMPKYRIPGIDFWHGNHRVLKPHIGMKIRCGSWSIIPAVSGVDSREVWLRHVWRLVLSRAIDTETMHILPNFQFLASNMPSAFSGSSVLKKGLRIR